MVGKGYANLWSHISSKHPDYEAILAKKKLGLPIDAFLHPNELNLYGWLGMEISYFSV